MFEAAEFDEKAIAEVSPQALMRLTHRGQWVAWTPRSGQVAAAGESREGVRAIARAAGVDRCLCEWILEDRVRHLSAVDG